MFGGLFKLGYILFSHLLVKSILFVKAIYLCSDIYLK